VRVTANAHNTRAHNTAAVALAFTWYYDNEHNRVINFDPSFVSGGY
jgi:hypothetical protein